MKRKRLRRALLWLLLLLLAAYHLPLHNVVRVLGMEGYYEKKEILMLVTRGPVWELLPAHRVMVQAEESFRDRDCADWQSARDQYGELGLYSQAWRFADGSTVDETHSLRLLTTHFFGGKGCLWVFYSQETHDAAGQITGGSWRVASLWEVEKNETGEWVVVRIREHP